MPRQSTRWRGYPSWEKDSLLRARSPSRKRWPAAELKTDGDCCSSRVSSQRTTKPNQRIIPPQALPPATFRKVRLRQQKRPGPSVNCREPHPLLKRILLQINAFCTVLAILFLTISTNCLDGRKPQGIWRKREKTRRLSAMWPAGQLRPQTLRIFVSPMQRPSWILDGIACQSLSNLQFDFRLPQ